jgi:hypothetical protein
MGTEAYFCGGGSGGVESHFGVGGSTDGARDGQARQWRDTEEQADAQSQGNARAVSIETSDGGDPNRPWSPKQLDTLVRLGRWLAETHNIPKRIAPAWDQAGFGWHRQYAQWNPNGHSCPGDVRLQQLKTEVLPRIFAPTDQGALSMADVTDILAAIADLKGDVADASRMIRVGDVAGGGTDPHDYSSNEGLGRKIDALAASFPTAAEIAAAIVAQLPASGSLDVAAIKAALEDVLGRSVLVVEPSTP